MADFYSKVYDDVNLEALPELFDQMASHRPAKCNEALQPDPLLALQLKSLRQGYSQTSYSAAQPQGVVLAQWSLRIVCQDGQCVPMVGYQLTALLCRSRPPGDKHFSDLEFLEFVVQIRCEGTGSRE